MLSFTNNWEGKKSGKQKGPFLHPTNVTYDTQWYQVLVRMWGNAGSCWGESKSEWFGNRAIWHPVYSRTPKFPSLVDAPEIFCCCARGFLYEDHLHFQQIRSLDLSADIYVWPEVMLLSWEWNEQTRATHINMDKPQQMVLSANRLEMVVHRNTQKSTVDFVYQVVSHPRTHRERLGGRGREWAYSLALKCSRLLAPHHTCFLLFEGLNWALSHRLHCKCGVEWVVASNEDHWHSTVKPPSPEPSSSSSITLIQTNRSPRRAAYGSETSLSDCGPARDGLWWWWLLNSLRFVVVYFIFFQGSTPSSQINHTETYS